MGRRGWNKWGQVGEVEDESGDSMGLSMRGSAGRVEELDFILRAV